MNRRYTLALLTALLLASAACLPAQAGSKDDRAAFFAADKIVRLDITVDAAGMEILRSTPHPFLDRKVGQGKGPMNLTEKPYVKATVVEDGKVTHKNVGVRLRGGMGSWQKVDEKPGLFLNLDKFVKGQRFHGMEKVILHNSHQDPRFMNELLTGEVYRAAGVPASRIVHALVTLNDRKLGLYYLKEGYDKGFFNEHFGNADGYLYQGDTGQDIDSWLELSYGEDGKYTPRDRSDLKALVAALQEPDLTLRHEKAAQLIDMERFMKYVAASVVLSVVDAYPMVGNNYRIYFDTRIKKLVFIPSGVDRCDFKGCAVEKELGGMAARLLLQTPQGRKQYLEAIEHVLAKAYDAPALVKRIDSLKTMLGPVLKECHPQQFASWDINFWIRGAIPKRPAEVAEMLRQARSR